MIITVLRARDLFNFALPDKASGQYLIYMDSGLLAGAISSIGGNWVLSLEKDSDLPQLLTIKMVNVLSAKTSVLQYRKNRQVSICI